MLWEFPLQSTDSYRMNFNEFATAFLNKLNLDETLSVELIIFSGSFNSFNLLSKKLFSTQKI